MGRISTGIAYTAQQLRCRKIDVKNPIITVQIQT